MTLPIRSFGTPDSSGCVNDVKFKLVIWKTLGGWVFNDSVSYFSKSPGDDITSQVVWASGPRGTGFRCEIHNERLGQPLKHKCSWIICKLNGNPRWWCPLCRPDVQEYRGQDILILRLEIPWSAKFHIVRGLFVANMIFFTSFENIQLKECTFRCINAFFIGALKKLCRKYYLKLS